MFLPPIWPSLQLLGGFVFPVQHSADTQGRQRCHSLVFAAGATSPSDLWSRVLLDQAWPVHLPRSKVTVWMESRGLNSTCPLPKDAPDKARILPGIPATAPSPSQSVSSQQNKTNSHLPQQLGVNQNLTFSCVNSDYHTLFQVPPALS